MTAPCLYLCYQSIQEPLTQTQVVAYLEGLTQAGYRIILLTFEPRALSPEETQTWRTRLEAKGITWHWRRYHKRPTVPATAFDILVGIITGWWLIYRYNVGLLHARCHVPGVMALVLKYLTGAKFLFDIRGFMAEEYVDAGRWKANGLFFRITKRVERALVEAADGYVILTRKGRALLEQWYPRAIRNKSLQMIPCCVDFRQFPERNGAARMAEPGTPIRALAYVGKLGGWYLVREMTDFVAVAMEVIPHLRWQVWTQSDPTALRTAAQQTSLVGRLTVGCVPADVLPTELARAHAGLAFIKPCLSKLASSATKVGEYLAAGIPVVATANIGDADEILMEPAPGSKPVGVLIREFTPAAYGAAAQQLQELLDDPDVAARCRAAAEAHFHLERIGWARYRALYQDLQAGHA